MTMILTTNMTMNLATDRPAAMITSRMTSDLTIFHAA
jgi:hypothetical protein